MEDRKYGQCTCFDQFILLFKYSIDSCSPQNKLFKIKFRIPKSGPRLPFENFYPSSLVIHPTIMVIIIDLPLDHLLCSTHAVSSMKDIMTTTTCQSPSHFSKSHINSMSSIKVPEIPLQITFLYTPRVMPSLLLWDLSCLVSLFYQIKPMAD